MNKHWDYLEIRALPRLGILTLRRKKINPKYLATNVKVLTLHHHTSQISFSLQTLSKFESQQTQNLTQ